MPQPDLEQSIKSLIASGDIRLAAEQLVTCYGSEVLGRCANLVGDHAIAEDLAQEVFGRALAGLSGFRGESTLRTWLFTIVRNVCIDHHRRAAGSAWIRDEDADAEAQPDERPILIDLMGDREQVGRALDALEETERALVVLRYVHGLGYPELASTFGIKEGATRMRLCRALEKMRAELVPQVLRQSFGARARREVESPAFIAYPEARMEETAPTLGAIRDDSAPALLDRAFDRALGLLLEAAEARPPVSGLLQGLRPTIDRLETKAPTVGERRGWLHRIFGRG